MRNYCVCCGAEIPEGRQVCLNCEKGERQRDLVFICSPFRGNLLIKHRNTRQAEKYCFLAYKRGYLPIAPHLYFTRFLDDNNGLERRQGIEMGKQLLLLCKKLWICGETITKGMREEIEFAKKNNIVIEEITL